MLTERESYLRKVNIRILQCDEQVRSDDAVTSREELEELMSHFTLRGGGGTDFRPAFDYVRDLIGEGAFTNLRGMIYFTDGLGIYPVKRPPWETAFVFLEEDAGRRTVPPWAIRLDLSPEDLEEDPAGKAALRPDIQFL